ncbi:MAG: DUF2617 family protein [Planctomycetota bacterium]
MTTPQKSNSLQTYQTLLYDRALHPELFQLCARSVVRHGAYELESWVLDGGHVLRFEHAGLCATELVSDQESGLPRLGVINAALCAGEQELDHRLPGGIHYMTTVQTEQLAENLYLATYREMLEHAEEVDATCHRFADESGECLSMLDIQQYSREIHVQSYHLLSAGGLVLRTQSIFEHA